MTPEEINHVQRTWEQVRPAADQVADTFYQTLFEMNPEYKKLFGTDMKGQGRKLMTMLGTAVSSLTRLPDIVPAVESLAERHVEYGVVAADYDVVGAALLKTLEAGLGDDFTPEVKDAWTQTYVTLAGVMIAAADKLLEPVD